ncbi:hypothetical protein [Pseudomonas sp. NPDC099000]|uniref:hypothetical protein n=1 Tax=Pseudomonas sp. NPDC099000 TaxID=3364488 RepID=UPI00383A5666
MQINQQKTAQVDVTELHLHIKVRDGFAAGLKDAQGEEVGSYEGYVPDFFPSDHYGDYLILNIDLELARSRTGRSQPLVTSKRCSLKAKKTDRRHHLCPFNEWVDGCGRNCSL